MSSRKNSQPGAAQATSGSFKLSLGCSLLFIPFALVAAFIVYTLISGVMGIGHSQQTCHTTSCSSTDNGSSGGSGGSDGDHKKINRVRGHERYVTSRRRVSHLSTCA